MRGNWRNAHRIADEHAIAVMQIETEAVQAAAHDIEQETLQNVISDFLSDKITVSEFIETAYDLGMSDDAITGIINQWNEEHGIW